MKKILFVAVATAAFAFASCGNKTAEAPAVADSTAQVEETSPANVAAQTVYSKLQEAGNDPAQLELAVGMAQAKIQELLQSGDAEAVKQYTGILNNLIGADKTVKDALSAAKTSTKSTLFDAFNSVVGAATQEGATAASFVEATKKAGTNALTETAQKAMGDAETAIEGGKEAVEAAKEAVENAPEQVKEAATKAVDDAKAKAAEAAQKKVDEGVQKANDAANKAVNKANGAANKAVNQATDKLKGKLGL